MPPTTRQMSDRHESDWADALGGWVTPGSGSTFAAQLDVHTSRERRFHWRLDGKSTLSRSISITRKMLDKLVEQAHSARPLLPIRFYDNERLTSAEDWVLARMADFVELDEAAAAAEKVRAYLETYPSYPDRYGEPGYGDLIADLLDMFAGREPHRSEEHLSVVRAEHAKSLREQVESRQRHR